MLEPVSTDCPYCGVSIEILVDCSLPEQEYIEDCQVCCRPIVFQVQVDENFLPTVWPRRDDD